MASKAIKEENFEIGSGNVYEDLGYKDADVMARKSALVHRIDTIIRDRAMTQTQAAEVLGVDQSDLSKILRGQFRSISLEKIFGMLIKLGEDATINVHTKPLEEAREAQLMVAFG
jgi:predicted XRE-type DNA-binding protein